MYSKSGSKITAQCPPDTTKIAYKFEGHAPDYIEAELKDCADMVHMLDAKMYSLNQAITEYSDERTDNTEET